MATLWFLAFPLKRKVDKIRFQWIAKKKHRNGNTTNNNRFSVFLGISIGFRILHDLLMPVCIYRWHTVNSDPLNHDFSQIYLLTQCIHLLTRIEHSTKRWALGGHKMYCQKCRIWKSVILSVMFYRFCSARIINFMRVLKSHFGVDK